MPSIGTRCEMSVSVIRSTVSRIERIGRSRRPTSRAISIATSTREPAATSAYVVKVGRSSARSASMSTTCTIAPVAPVSGNRTGTTT